MKFGGTSVADAEAMRRVIGIVKRQLESNPDDRPPVVVVSAMSKVTDRLVETSRLAGTGDADGAARILADLLERHVGVASALVAGGALADVTALLTSDFGDQTTAVRALAAQRDVPPRAYDALVAMGELASSRMAAAAFV